MRKTVNLTPEELALLTPELRTAFTEINEAGIRPELSWDEFTPHQRQVWERHHVLVFEFFKKNFPEDIAAAHARVVSLN